MAELPGKSQTSRLARNVLTAHSLIMSYPSVFRLRSFTLHSKKGNATTCCFTAGAAQSWSEPPHGRGGPLPPPRLRKGTSGYWFTLVFEMAILFTRGDRSLAVTVKKDMCPAAVILEAKRTCNAVQASMPQFVLATCDLESFRYLFA